MRKLLSSLLSLLSMNSTKASFLKRARELEAPAALTESGGETEGVEFWNEHANLLRKAWLEWEREQEGSLPNLNDDTIYEPELRSAVKAAWKDPSKEGEVRSLWEEIVPNVYTCQLLQPDRIADIRAYIDAASNAGIPTRRPNGMNRYGLILDPSTEGAVMIEGLDKFYQNLVNEYIRPLGRLFFPEYMQPADDAESYAFTIRYKEGEDVQLREHSDASLITMNINLNIPSRQNETNYEGSILYFVDEETGEHHEVKFQAGMAVLHRGMIRHAAQPIVQGERTNLVVWLFGQHGYVRFVPYEEHERMTPRQRWSKPKVGRRYLEL